MNPEPDGIPFVLTQAEKSRAAWVRVAIENHVRETNRRDQQKSDAMLRGNNARLGVVEGQG